MRSGPLTLSSLKSKDDENGKCENLICWFHHGMLTKFPQDVLGHMLLSCFILECDMSKWDDNQNIPSQIASLREGH